MGLLDGQIKSIVASAFKGRLLKGTLRRKTISAVNNLGDATSETTSDYDFEGMRDSFSLRYAEAHGIPVTDARILIIAGSVSTEPQRDDKINIGGSWYQCRRVVEIDPAGATYLLAAFQVVDGG